VTIKVELFYSPICPRCPEAKRVLLEVLEEINVFSPRGLKRAKKYDIAHIPAVVIENKRKIIGVPKKESLLRKIKQEITLSQVEERS